MFNPIAKMAFGYFFRNLENVCGKGGQQTNGKKWIWLTLFSVAIIYLQCIILLSTAIHIMNFINKRLHDWGNDSGGFDFEFSQPD